MPRYILIDQYSGYIFGDTAEYAAGLEYGMYPELAAKLLDESIGVYSREYTAHRHTPQKLADEHSDGYYVYRAEDGENSIPVVTDGQDADAIDAVERLCEYVCFVRATTRRE